MDWLLECLQDMGEDEAQWSCLKTIIDASGRNAPSFACWFSKYNLCDLAKERLFQYRLLPRVRLFTVYAAVKLKMLAMRARERAWQPGSNGVCGLFDRAKSLGMA